MTLLTENVKISEKKGGINIYIDLKPYLTHQVQKIDYFKLKPSRYGNRSFYLNDSIYFFKGSNLNELIGEQLAKELNLRTVNFYLFQDVNTDKILMASKNFINPNSKYILWEQGLDITNYQNNYFKEKCIDNDNYHKLLINIFKMFAIDTYMRQNDRCYLNYQFEEYDSGYFDLAPLYDYTEACWDQYLSYNCELFNFLEYRELFTNYEDSLEIFKRIKKVDLKKTLEKIELSKGIKLPQEVIDIYLRREELAQKN